MQANFFEKKKRYCWFSVIGGFLFLASFALAGNVYGADLNSGYFSGDKEYTCFSSASDSGQKMTVKVDATLSSTDTNPHRLKVLSGGTDKNLYCTDGNESGLFWDGKKLSEIRVRIGVLNNEDDLQKLIEASTDSMPGINPIKNFAKGDLVFIGALPVNQSKTSVQFRYLNDVSKEIVLGNGTAAKIGVGNAVSEKVKKIEITFKPQEISQAAFRRVVYVTWGDQNFINQGRYAIKGKVSGGFFSDRPYQADIALENGQGVVKRVALPYVIFPLAKEYEYIDGRTNRYDSNGYFLGYSINSGQEETFWRPIWGQDIAKEKTWYFPDGKIQKFESYNADGSLAKRVLFDDQGCYRSINEYGTAEEVTAEIYIDSCKIDGQTGKMSFEANKYLLPGKAWFLTQVYKNGQELVAERKLDAQAIVKSGQEILKSLDVSVSQGYEAAGAKIVGQFVGQYYQDIAAITKQEKDANLRQVKIHSKYVALSEKLKRAFWGLENLLDSNVKYSALSKEGLVVSEEISKDKKGNLTLGFWVIPYQQGKGGASSVFLDLTNEASVKKILDNLKGGWNNLKKLEKLSQATESSSSLVGNLLSSVGSFLKSLFINEALAAYCAAADEYDNCRYGGIRANAYPDQGSVTLSQAGINETDPNLIGGGYFWGDTGKFYFYNMFTNQLAGGYMPLEEYLKPDPTTNQLLTEFLNNEMALLNSEGKDISTVSDLDIIIDFYRYFAARADMVYKYDKSEAYQTVGESIARGGGNCGDFALFTMNTLQNLLKHLNRNSAADRLYYATVIISENNGGHAIITFDNTSVDGKWYYLESGVIGQGFDTSSLSDSQVMPQITMPPVGSYMAGGSANDAYSYIANWNVKVYFFTNGLTYTPVRSFYIQGPQPTGTVLGFTGQPAGTSRGGLVASISTPNVYVTPNDPKVDQLANLIDSAITTKISNDGLAKNEVAIMRYANMEFKEIVTYVARADYDTWQSGAQTLAKKYPNNMPNSLATMRNDKITGDCDILAFLEASVVRNLLQRYYQTQGLTNYVEKARNNLVVLGAVGHLDLGYISDYKFDEQTGLAVFDYINGKLNLLKFNDYVASVPVTNTPAVLFAGCNKTQAIGAGETNWSTYTTNLIIAILFPCSWLGEALFGSCDDGGAAATVADPITIPPVSPQQPCEDTTRVSCPTFAEAATDCNQNTLYCENCACYVDPNSEACANISPGTPPIMADIPAETAIISQAFEFNTSPYITKTEDDAITEVDCSLITTDAGDGSYNTVIDGVKFAAYSDGSGTNFIFFGTPATSAAGTHSCDFKAKDDDGWSGTTNLTINVVDERLPRFVVPSQNATQGEVYQLNLANYVISPTAIVEYKVSGLPSGLSYNTSTGVISGTPTAIAVSEIIPEARNSVGWGGGASEKFTLSVGAKVSLCEDQPPKDMYRVPAGQTVVIQARSYPANRCVKVKNSTAKDIMVPNKTKEEFTAFENSNWKANPSNGSISNVTYSYGAWGGGGLSCGPMTVTYTRSCLRNDGVAADCSYCGGVCSTTNTATLIDYHNVYTGWVCGGHGYSPIYVHWYHYYINGQYFSYSWWNCGVAWGYECRFDSFTKAWPSGPSAYVPNSD